MAASCAQSSSAGSRRAPFYSRRCIRRIRVGRAAALPHPRPRRQDYFAVSKLLTRLDSGEGDYLFEIESDIMLRRKLQVFARVIGATEKACIDFADGYRKFEPGLLAQGGLGGPPGPLGLAIAYDSRPLFVEFAWHLMEATYLWPPWLSESFHPRLCLM
jgi:hypothetical protein